MVGSDFRGWCFEGALMLLFFLGGGRFQRPKGILVGVFRF